MVVSACNPSPWEVETKGPAQDQPGLQETLGEKPKQTNKKKKNPYLFYRWEDQVPENSRNQ